MRAGIAGFWSGSGGVRTRASIRRSAAFVVLAWHITNRLQPGRLDVYMRVTFGVIVATVWITMNWAGSLPTVLPFPGCSSTNGPSSAS